MKLTLSEVRRHHTGTWFFNTVPSKGSRILGDIRKGKYILTHEAAPQPYWVWGVYDVPGDYKIQILTKFQDKDRALSEIGSETLSAIYDMNKPRG